VQVKYTSNTHITKMSWIWKEIFKLTPIYNIGCNMKVVNGMHTLFWTDRWHSDNSLSSTYVYLFNCCIVPNIIVFEVVMYQGQALKFNRQLTRMLLQDFNDMCTCIQHTHLSCNVDYLIWRWQGNGKFTTRSAYE
jgi:hypothetical protein